MTEPVARRAPATGRAGRLARALLCSGIGLLLAGCTPPDLPSTRAARMPVAVLDLLAPDTARAAVLHPGVTYRYLWSPRGPWAVHLVGAQLRDRCELGFDVLRASGREGGGGGREAVSGMVARSAERVLAAVNADFFTADGHAVGVEIVDGVVRSSAARPTFAWRPGDEPWMGPARVEDGVVRLGWPVAVASAGGSTEAVGGFPDLIDAGARVGDLEVSARASFAAARHPRTAVGWDADRGVLWFAVVDGRRPPYSVGMSLPELAELFEALGAEEALNLDGGGSSALVLGGGPVNRPSDATGERAVVNALALVRDAAGCRT